MAKFKYLQALSLLKGDKMAVEYKKLHIVKEKGPKTNNGFAYDFTPTESNKIILDLVDIIDQFETTYRGESPLVDLIVDGSRITKATVKSKDNIIASKIEYFKPYFYGGKSNAYISLDLSFNTNKESFLDEYLTLSEEIIKYLSE